MPTALFLSPHLDDVAFSCGATLALLAARGWRCVLASAFTRSVPAPSGFALACQTDKGLSPEVDYMQLRRDEDATFARVVGAADVRWLGLAEAPHRGCASAAELFAAPRHDDDAAQGLSDLLLGLCRELRPRLLFAPLALGHHVDHVQARRAVQRLAGAPAIAWYRDMPYAMRVVDVANADDGPQLPDGTALRAMPVGPTLHAKLDGCAAYRSQLGFQFAGEQRMRETLAAFAFAEGRVAGLDAPAERFAMNRVTRRLMRETLAVA